MKKQYPQFKSKIWNDEQWRYIRMYEQRDLFDRKKIIGYDISYDIRCGKKGYAKNEKGKKRLCLPKEVIEKLLKTKKGREALIQQALKKMNSKKSKVPWNDLVKKEVSDFRNARKEIARKKGIRERYESRLKKQNLEYAKIAKKKPKKKTSKSKSRWMK